MIYSLAAHTQTTQRHPPDGSHHQEKPLTQELDNSKEGLSTSPSRLWVRNWDIYHKALQNAASVN